MKAIVQHTSSRNVWKCQKIRNSSLKTGKCLCAVKRVRKRVIFLSEIPWDHARESTRLVTLPTCQSRSVFWQVNHLCHSWQAMFSKVYGHQSKGAKRMSMLNDVIRLFCKREQNKRWKYAKKRLEQLHTVPGTWEFRRRLGFVRCQHQRPIINLRPGWCWELLQELESFISSCKSETSQRAAYRTCAFNHKIHVWYNDCNRGSHSWHIPPSRLRDSLLLAERVKRGAGRSIMELAWRVWAWVRPLYRNLEPKTRKRRDEGGSTVGTLRHKNIDLIFIHPPQFHQSYRPTYQEFKCKLYITSRILYSLKIVIIM